MDNKTIDECIAAYRKMIKYSEEMIEDLERKKRIKKFNHRFKIIKN